MIKKILILTLACVGLTGCVPHFKEWDSYQTNFRNDEIQSMPGKGDAYTFGGIAEGSGGTYARQSYATDNPTLDARDSTAKLGEIAKDRTQFPGGLPGVSGTLPGAKRTDDPFELQNKIVTTAAKESDIVSPNPTFIDNATGQEIKAGDPRYQKLHEAWAERNKGGAEQVSGNSKSKIQNPKSGAAPGG